MPAANGISLATQLAPATAPSLGVAFDPAPSFDFGGLVVSVHCSDPAWLYQVAERFQGFAVAATAQLDIAYTTTATAPPSPRALYRARQQPATVSAQGRYYELSGHAYRARYHLDTRQVEITGPLATYPLDHTLQVLWYLHHRSGVIVHTAAVAHDDRSWLLSGPSGVGKSTLAALFHEHALCDEMAAVDLVDERVVCRSLPFWSGRRGSASLSGIYLLHHGPDNRRRPLAPAVAFHRLSRQVIWPIFDRSLLRSSLDSLAAICERVPVWELHFRPDRDVWELLTRRPQDEARRDNEP